MEPLAAAQIGGTPQLTQIPVPATLTIQHGAMKHLGALTSIGSSTGVQATSATKGGSGSVLGAISQFSSVTSLLSGLISGKTIAKTIGQALSDGFSCWGATWTPSRAENELPYWLNLIHQEFTKSLDVKREDLEASLNNFYQEFPPTGIL